MVARIPLDHARIAEFCRRHHIRRLSLFGSVLRDDFRDDSDVDVLYVFDPEHIPGWEIVDIAEELSRLLGRDVDMAPEKHLNRRMRDDVLRSAEVVYDDHVPSDSSAFGDRTRTRPGSAVTIAPPFSSSP